LLGMHGRLWAGLVLSSIKWLYHPWTPALGSLDWYWKRQTWLPGALVHAELGHKEESDRVGWWQNPARSGPLWWKKD
jgi:hypothetical protein